MKFVSEAVTPQGDFDADAIGRGEPGLPSGFTWRDQDLAIAGVRKTWKGHKTDRGDVYVKRHYFDVDLADGRVATLYFERQARPGQPRWWLYTISG